MNFREMHRQPEPLLICNVWDAASARVAQRVGFGAIATSSFAMAAMLGYEDGEQLSFQELRYLVARIAAVSTLPLSVDIESGYSREPKDIVTHIRELAELGVVGVNIEDSLVDQGRSLVNAEAFAEILAKVKAGLQAAGCDVFLNVRTDPFLLGLDGARAETVRRGALYAQAGADGLFVPCIVQSEDIAAITKAVPLPINVLSRPQLPSYATLQALGVKRVSMGNALFDHLQDNLQARLSEIHEHRTLASIFEVASAC